MTTIRTHDGSWTQDDEIQVIESKDQYVGDTSTTDYAYSLLGLDTEFLLLDNKKEVIWPWEKEFPQQRDPNSLKTSNGQGEFDFHGDGYATELCIKPTHCLEVMTSNRLSPAFDWLRIRNAPKFSAPAIYSIPKGIEEAAPEEAKRLGCMPSLNVYGDAGNPSSLASNKRTTGCHLHISHPVLQSENIAISLIKWADILVGCTWTYISPNPSKAEAERRKAYGRAGEYRLKVYPTFPQTDLSNPWSVGVEYRVLPGTPIQHPAYLTLMFNLYRSALRLAYKYGDPTKDLSAQAKEAINSADKAKAKSVIRSLPISEEGRKLIRFLRRAPMRLEDTKEWWALGSYGKGHQYLYLEKNLGKALLTL